MEQTEQLKPREIEVLRLMADGLTNRAIAEQLYLGVETVRWYSKQIYSKLDVSGRTEAATRAQSLGLLDGSHAEIPRPITPEHNLPAQLTSFIGREKQIAEIEGLLSETRLLTLTGPGGTGKTRLSLKVAERVGGGFADGAHFVNLAPVAESEAVASAILEALNILESGDEPEIDTLVRSIGGREMLLVLDNYEHVMEAASIVPELLAATPNIKIIVTSREPLRVSGEQVYPVPPMLLNEDDQEEPESVTLFIERARAVKPGFRMDVAGAGQVAAICAHLDGMPLAIELAAALTRLLTPDAILAQMDSRFDSLKGGSRDAPARQQTLRNAIDWSYDLLSEGEKMLFARLAVFRGGRSLEAIEAVCGADLPIGVLDGLIALVDKSMIRQDEDELGEPRFVMLETIHQYAAERLDASGEAEAMRVRHAHYFADLAEHARTYLRRAGQEYWFPRLRIEQDNIRAALRWSLFGGEAQVGLRLVAALRDYWYYEGQHIEGMRWAQQAMEHLEDAEPSLQAGVLATAGFLSNARQEVQQSLMFGRQAIEIVRQLGDSALLAWTLFLLAQSGFDASDRTQADYDEAVAACEEGLALCRKSGDRIELAFGLNILGNLHRNQGVFDQAKDVYEECLALCHETGERRRVVITLGNLSKVALGLGNPEEAYQLARDGLRLSAELQFTYMTVLAIESSFIALLTALGYAERAARLLGACNGLGDEMNIRQQPNNAVPVARARQQVREELGDAAYEALFAEGRALSLDEAVALALSDLGD